MKFDPQSRKQSILCQYFRTTRENIKKNKRTALRVRISCLEKSIHSSLYWNTDVGPWTNISFPENLFLKTDTLKILKLSIYLFYSKGKTPANTQHISTASTKGVSAKRNSIQVITRSLGIIFLWLLLSAFYMLCKC